MKRKLFRTIILISFVLIAQLQLINYSSAESSEKDILKNATLDLTWAYYQGDNSRWYISQTTGNRAIYSLYPIRTSDGATGWRTVTTNGAAMDLVNNTVKTDSNIAADTNTKAYDVGYKQYVDESRILSDRQNINNKTVQIKWYFLKASNSKWYIINLPPYSSGKPTILRFSSKGSEFDWIPVDTTGLVPNFYIENGSKKLKFTSSATTEQGSVKTLNTTDNDWNVSLCDNNSTVEAVVNCDGQAPADVKFNLVIDGTQRIPMSWNSSKGKYYVKCNKDAFVFGKNYNFSLAIDASGTKINNTTNSKSLTIGGRTINVADSNWTVSLCDNNTNAEAAVDCGMQVPSDVKCNLVVVNAKNAMNQKIPMHPSGQGFYLACDSDASIYGESYKFSIVFESTDTKINNTSTVKSLTIGNIIVGNSSVVQKAALIIKKLLANNYSNKAIANVLANVEVECSFTPKSENLNYSAATLMRLYGPNNGKNKVRFQTYAEAQALAAKGPDAIGNFVYGGRMENNTSGDGFKYRGRGYIQLTGKCNYSDIGTLIGLDLINSPDLANDPQTAAAILPAYFKNRKATLSSMESIDNVIMYIGPATNTIQKRKDLAQIYSNIDFQSMK